MLIVADTSALIALAACDSLPLLDHLFTDVRVPGPFFESAPCLASRVDDYRTRKVAYLNGIEVIGSLGVLLIAKEAGFIAKIRPLIIEIQNAGVRYGEQLVNEVLQLAGE